jgi:hypothetical protein
MMAASTRDSKIAQRLWLHHSLICLLLLSVGVNSCFRREAWPDALAAKRDICAGCDCDSIAAGESQRIARVPGSPALIIGVAGHGQQLNIGPIEHHSQGAQIIDVAA